MISAAFSVGDLEKTNEKLPSRFQGSRTSVNPPFPGRNFGAGFPVLFNNSSPFDKTQVRVFNDFCLFLLIIPFRINII